MFRKSFNEASQLFFMINNEPFNLLEKRSFFLTMLRLVFFLPLSIAISFTAFPLLLMFNGASKVIGMKCLSANSMINPDDEVEHSLALFEESPRLSHESIESSLSLLNEDAGSRADIMDFDLTLDLPPPHAPLFVKTKPFSNSLIAQKEGFQP